MTHLRVSLRHVLISFVLAAASIGAGVAIAAPSGDDKPGERQSARDVRELPELRTRTSNTYLTERGTNRTRIDTGPVNYRKDGKWQPIQNELKDSAAPGYAFENTANHWSVKIPDALESKPVEVRDGDAFVRFAPVGAKGEPGKLGSIAGYRSIYPGVDATYEVQDQGVKETLILASRDSRASYEFDVDVSDGLKAREGDGGSIEFVDGDGEIRFAFAPPSLEDAAGVKSSDASMRLERDGSGYRVVLKAEREWLDDPARKYPVELDPTTTVRYPSPDCYMVSGTKADTSFCGYAWNYLDVGTDGEGLQRRAYLAYDVSSVPSTAEVVEGEFWFNVEAGNSREVHLHRATRSSTQARTWNKYDGTNAWTTPGGDITASADGKGTLGGTTGFQRIQARQLVQDWVDKTHAASNGIILKDGSGTNNILTLSASDQGAPNRPQLDIEWSNRIGEQERWTFADQQITDRTTLRTNVANGNLVVKENDVRIPGIAGHNLDFTRYFNSQDGDGGGGDLGFNWNGSTGYDVWLNSEGGGATEAFQGPSGFWAPYDKNPDGSYKTPTGMNADLKKNADGTFTLTYRSSNRKLNFNSGGVLTSDKDRNDNTMSFTYGGPSSKLSAIKDTRDHSTTNNTLSFTYNSSGYIQTITDRLTPTARTWNYTYTGNKLTSYTNPDSKTTSYGYNASNDLTTITDARGTVTTITYDTQHRVTEIWRDSSNAGPKTKYEYPATLSSDCSGVGSGEQAVVGETIERDPLYPGTGTSHTVKYCWDKHLRVQKTIDGRGKTRRQGYTANSDINKLTTAGNQSWDLSYDSSDRADKAEAPATTSGGPRMSQQFGYDSTVTDRSNPKFWLASSFKDERNNQVNYRYDSKGNMTDVDLPLASQNNIHLVYNTNGTTQSVRDANGTGTTAYGYTNGNVTSVDRQAPLGDESYTYDAVHRVATHTDGRAQVATYTYDKLDRMTNISYTGGATIAYTYDNVGNRTQRVDNTGTSTYVFDRLNRPTQENPAGRETTNWTYDLAGNVKTHVDGGGTTTYNYGVSNLLDSMTAPSDAAATTFAYTDDDARKTTTYPNGVVMSADWEDGSTGNLGPGRLKKIEAKKGTTTISSFTYGYTPSTTVCGGTSSADTTLRHSVTDKNGSTAQYCYDNLNRMVTANNHGGQNYTYTLDGNGNITKRVKGTATTSYGFNAANQMCWSVGNSQASAACSPTPTGATTYVYDTAGNLDTSSGGLNLDYNAKEQTTSMNSLTGGTSHTKVYAGPNQFERITAGPIAYTHNALGISKQDNAGNVSRFRRDHDGGLHSERLNDGSLYYYVFDGLGSVVALTDSAGTAPTTYTYDPYGETTRTGTTSNPWRYASGYQDSGSDFYKFGARYYMPTLQRWTTQDPMEQLTDPVQANRYAYAGLNPINYTDPMGTHIVGDLWNKGKKFVKGVAKKFIPANGLACYIRKSVAGDDTNRFSDDIGDAINCLNPISGYTGEVGGTDD